MLFLIGLVVVFGCVLGSYVQHGNIKVLWQPLEFIIILGAGIGAMIISQPGWILKGSLKSLKNIFKGNPFKKKDYMELLKFLFEIFKLIKTKGLLQIEPHIDKPSESEIFQKYPFILHDHHVLDFFCDNIRLLTLGVENQYIMGDAMEQELEVHHHDGLAYAGAIGNFGESLPALGIVAAVLGVIVTMGSISEPPDILGGLIGAALVGTFVGILLSYGLFSPLGTSLTHYVNAESTFYNCIKIGIISHLQGNAPSISVEIVRKNIPSHYRPTFVELDTAINAPAAPTE